MHDGGKGGARTPQVKRGRECAECQEWEHGRGLQQERGAPAEWAGHQPAKDVTQRVPDRDAQVEGCQPARLGPRGRIVVCSIATPQITELDKRRMQAACM